MRFLSLLLVLITLMSCLYLPALAASTNYPYDQVVAKTINSSLGNSIKKYSGSVGTTQNLTYTSASGASRTAVVYLPAGYNSSQKYNVLMFYPGQNTSAPQWMSESTGTFTTKQFLDYMFANEFGSFIVVAMSDNCNLVTKTDVAAKDVATVYDMIVTKYSTYATTSRNAPAHFAFCGFSLGGYAGNAVMADNNLYDKFGYFMIAAGSYQNGHQSKFTQKVYNNLVRDPKLAAFVYGGSSDAGYYEINSFTKANVKDANGNNTNIRSLPTVYFGITGSKGHGRHSALEHFRSFVYAMRWDKARLNSPSGVSPSTPSVATYTIMYNANGGTGAPGAQTKIKDKTLTLSSATPAKATVTNTTYTVTFNANGGSSTGASGNKMTAAKKTTYTFTGWNTNASGAGTSYAKGGSYTANANTTLYAQYRATTSTDSITLPTPKKSGYVFLGWSTSKTAKSGVTGSYTPTQNVTLYAIWGFDLTFDANGGTGAPAPQRKVLNNNLTLTSQTPVKANTETTGYTVTFNANGGSSTGAANNKMVSKKITKYTFSKWTTNQNGSGSVYYPGKTYSGFATMKLYAQYTSSTSNGSIQLPTAQRSGYTFLGWSTSKSAQSATYKAGASYTPSANVTLYAVWKANAGNSGSNSSASAPSVTSTVNLSKVQCYSNTKAATYNYIGKYKNSGVAYSTVFKFKTPASGDFNSMDILLKYTAEVGSQARTMYYKVSTSASFKQEKTNYSFTMPANTTGRKAARTQELSLSMDLKPNTTYYLHVISVPGKANDGYGGVMMNTTGTVTLIG